MADPKKWNDPIFPEIDFADILDSEEAGLANDAGSQKVWKKGTLTSYLSTLYQALNANLTELAALAFANNKLLYIDGSGNLALADLTAAGRALLDDADAAAQRATLDVDSSSEVDSKIDTDIATHSADTTAVHGITDTAQLTTLNTAQTITGVKTFNEKMLTPKGFHAIGDGVNTGVIVERRTLNTSALGVGAAFDWAYIAFDDTKGLRFSKQPLGNIQDGFFGANPSSTTLIQMISTGVKIGAQANPTQMLDVAGNLIVNGWIGSTGTTLAGFSSAGAINGALFWITNGRKSGEGTGLGTGVWGVWDTATSTLYYQDSVSTAKTAVVA